MNEPMPGHPGPQQPGTPPGHRLEPGAAPHGPARRPPGTPGAPQPGTPVRYPAADSPQYAAAGTADVPAGTETQPCADAQSPPEHAPAPQEEQLLDEGPQPLGLHVEPTGHPPVDARLRRLEDADHLAVSGHLEVYEDVHRGLRDTLTALDRHDPHPRS